MVLNEIIDIINFFYEVKLYIKEKYNRFFLVLLIVNFGLLFLSF